MTKREFFKILKEKKLFTKYCIAVASAFSSGYYQQPHTRGENYIEGWLNYPNWEIEQYINAIEKDWTVIRNIIIQY